MATHEPNSTSTSTPDATAAGGILDRLAISIAKHASLRAGMSGSQIGLHEQMLRDAHDELVRLSSARPEVARITEWLRENAPDCGDNSCLFGGRGKGGMRTNGGCRCFKDVRPDMKRIFIERMWTALCVPSPPRRSGGFGDALDGDGLEKT